MSDTIKSGSPTPAKKKLSAFALARPSESVGAEITVADVLELRPNWSRQQAAEFLANHTTEIGQAMVLRGVEVLVGMLGTNSDAN